MQTEIKISKVLCANNINIKRENKLKNKTVNKWHNKDSPFYFLIAFSRETVCKPTTRSLYCCHRNVRTEKNI